MVAYESAVWLRLGHCYCPQKERKRSLEGDSGKTHYYQCHVAPDGSYKFKGHLLENTGTHLHKVLGDDNVLTVKFDDVSGEETFCNDLYSIYKGIAKNGIMVGLRRYQFFVFKDGGKEGKKKDFSTKGVKCYFIRTGSTALSDMENPYILDGMSIHEARMRFMHLDDLPSPANYMARFSLILSKTKKLEVDTIGITFEKIDDIHCHKGKSIRSNNIQGPCGQDPPLLIQFRMFYKGYAVKGTFLLNKKGSQLCFMSQNQVYEDQTLSNFSTFNSLEVVTTSNPPKMTRLSRNLVALLSYGGVPNDFFSNILLKTLAESETIFYNERAAFRAAINYGDMDDQNTAEMILFGIPLDEPHLKDRLYILLNTEKNALKEGRLPITESYYLMGTVDPTGKLKKNEVCVILESGQISGNVLVYRNPGLHFGDIHVLKATYVEALEDYVGNSKYVVFFPQNGPRSLGDEIAGGDFDGDMYFVSRNPKLLEHFKPSEPWVSSSKPSKVYSGRKPNELSQEELEEELFKLFLNARFRPSDVIGMAADSWLAIMDRFLTLGDESAKQKHEMNKNMLKLIDIYYDALDAPKKGAKVDLPPDLQVGTFPHYMDRKKKKFKSTSILGLIFDTVDSHNAAISPPSKISKLTCFEDEPVPESHMEKCRRWYKNYREDMNQAMMERDENKKKQLTNEVNKRYKLDFYGAAGFEDSKRSLEELYPQALALYNIAYDYAIKKNEVRYCGVVWRVAGPMEKSTSSDLKSSVNGGVVDVYGEDSATIEHNITPWSLSVSSGYSLLRDPRYNKGLAFTEKERDTHYLRGLLPPVVLDQKLQEKRLMNNIRQYQFPLQKYMALTELQERNERLFYKLLIDNVEELLPIVYTPTVGEACQKFGSIFRRPQGLFISLKDKGKILDVLKNWPERNIQVIVVTDGERILGLGDLGCQGMGIPVGKLALYSALGGVRPSACLPVTIDVGTNNEKLLNDEFYIGLRQKRATGQEYSELLNEFMSAVKQNYGENVLIQFEDFANHNAFELLAKYRDTHLVFNDDIQGTASVVLAGLVSAQKLTNSPLAEHTFLFLGAGEAGTGIAELIALYMSKQMNASVEESRKKIWLVDSKGLIVNSRKDSLQDFKKPWAHEHEPVKDLLGAIKAIKPTVLIGSSGVGRSFTKEVIEAMSSINERPLIMALSNPTTQSECTAEEAYTWSKGRAIFASGSPFDPVEYEGKVFVSTQANNAYIFPGFGLGLVISGAIRVHDDMLLAAAEALAGQVSKENYEKGMIYPSFSSIRKISAQIAANVATKAYELGLAGRLPRPKDIVKCAESSMYSPTYRLYR
ncbi:Malic enzyme N-terminal domain [Arabidopsis suecica]|uniref:Multifunctional fusion protein n=1 Tax=Arabidopsis suecica TaxID=45249 RepID=A0A8T2G1L3_ARASU|nr:Malic enzyme N-terminal domain [Arabidopsis suecica]